MENSKKWLTPNNNKSDYHTLGRMIEQLLNEELEPQVADSVIKAFSVRQDILNFELKAAAILSSSDVRKNHREVETKLFEPTPIDYEKHKVE